MNLQSNRNYLARTTRPADGQIAEKDGQCQLLELSMGLDPRATEVDRHHCRLGLGGGDR